MTQAILQLISVEKNFPGVKALDKASLSVYQGRVMALMGENGAGKSTLMKILTGIYTMDAGSIYYQGRKSHFKNPRHSQQQGISIIHQELNLIPDLTIAENIFLGREFTNVIGHIQWSKIYEIADKLLARLNVKHSSKKLLGSLSLGEQQMVEIAKALSFESKVIIMDEPTDALTDKESASLFKVITELRNQGCGIVYISHRLKEIFEICDDITVLRDGKFIGEYKTAKTSENNLIEMMVGRKIEEQYPRIKTNCQDICLEVKNLTNRRLHNVSFKLRCGEVLGFAGLIGAGRTELMRTIYGALPSTSGEIHLSRKRINPTSSRDGLSKGIAYVSEDRKRDGLLLNLSVKENISLCVLNRLTQMLTIQCHEEVAAVEYFIKLFNIKTPNLNQIVGKLSGGNQQKVAIAKALMTRPKVLILDEPTRGVDVGAKKEIYQLINKFKAESMSIILVSSEMPELLGMSDRIIVMHKGQISGEFSAEDTNQEQLMSCAVGKKKERTT